MAGAYGDRYNDFQTAEFGVPLKRTRRTKGLHGVTVWEAVTAILAILALFSLLNLLTHTYLLFSITLSVLCVGICCLWGKSLNIVLQLTLSLLFLFILSLVCYAKIANNFSGNLIQSRWSCADIPQNIGRRLQEAVQLPLEAFALPQKPLVEHAMLPPMTGTRCETHRLDALVLGQTGFVGVSAILLATLLFNGWRGTQMPYLLHRELEATWTPLQFEGRSRISFWQCYVAILGALFVFTIVHLVIMDFLVGIPLLLLLIVAGVAWIFLKPDSIVLYDPKLVPLKAQEPPDKKRTLEQSMETSPVYQRQRVVLTTTFLCTAFAAVGCIGVRLGRLGPHLAIVDSTGLGTDSPILLDIARHEAEAKIKELSNETASERNITRFLTESAAADQIDGFVIGHIFPRGILEALHEDAKSALIRIQQHQRSMSTGNIRRASSRPISPILTRFFKPRRSLQESSAISEGSTLTLFDPLDVALAVGRFSVGSQVIAVLTALLSLFLFLGTVPGYTALQNKSRDTIYVNRPPSKYLLDIGSPSVTIHSFHTQPLTPPGSNRASFQIRQSFERLRLSPNAKLPLTEDDAPNESILGPVIVKENLSALPNRQHSSDNEKDGIGTGKNYGDTASSYSVSLPDDKYSSTESELRLRRSPESLGATDHHNPTLITPEINNIQTPKCHYPLSHQPLSFPCHPLTTSIATTDAAPRHILTESISYGLLADFDPNMCVDRGLVEEYVSLCQKTIDNVGTLRVRVPSLIRTVHKLNNSLTEGEKQEEYGTLTLSSISQTVETKVDLLHSRVEVPIQQPLITAVSPDERELLSNLSFYQTPHPLLSDHTSIPSQVPPHSMCHQDVFSYPPARQASQSDVEHDKFLSTQSSPLVSENSKPIKDCIQPPKLDHMRPLATFSRNASSCSLSVPPFPRLPTEFKRASHSSVASSKEAVVASTQILSPVESRHSKASSSRSHRNASDIRIRNISEKGVEGDCSPSVESVSDTTCFRRPTSKTVRGSTDTHNGKELSDQHSVELAVTHENHPSHEKTAALSAEAPESSSPHAEDDVVVTVNLPGDGDIVVNVTREAPLDKEKSCLPPEVNDQTQSPVKDAPSTTEDHCQPGTPSREDLKIVSRPDVSNGALGATHGKPLYTTSTTATTSVSLNAEHESATRRNDAKKPRKALAGLLSTGGKRHLQRLKRKAPPPVQLEPTDTCTGRADP